MKKALLLAAGISLFIAACSKDDDNAPEPEPEPDPIPEQITFMTNNSWKIDSMGFDSDNNGVMDNKLTLLACDADNMLNFSADSTGAFNEGASKCDDAAPQETAITWHFKDNTYQAIIMDGLTTQLDGEVKVLSLTESNLVLSAPGTAGTLIVALKE